MWKKIKIRLHAPVAQVFHLVDPNQPVLGRVRLLQHVQLKVLVADLGTSNPVVPGRLATLGVDLPEPVVAHLVHQTVEQRRRALLVDAEVPAGRVVVRFLDVGAAVGAAADAHHPQELVNV